ncbi:hypothetical protein QQF64_015517 [Cirrhinus molitorella]|uniref:TRIM8/14/16/25/29/45/65 coiled-coil region domain-containing protein n=1 Tax=Cirrhinus molitorella TaxID=172907 RepID=A0ABR3NVX7_9TELE
MAEASILVAEAERTEKQKQVEKTVTIIQKKIEERQTELQNLRESVQTHKRSAQAAVEDKNHIHFLQNFQFHAVPPASSDSTNISSLLSYDDVRRSVSIIRSKLEHFCREEIEKISGGAKIKFLTPITQPETREHFLHYYHPFTLDSETVHKNISKAERTVKQKQLLDIQRKLQKRIQRREKIQQELKEALKTHKHSAQAAVEDSERIFTELICSIERSRLEVVEMIRDQEKAEVNRAEGLLKQLQQEIDDLRRRDAELKQLSQTDDHIHFLQSFQSLSVPPESTKSINVSSVLTYDDVGKSVSMLREKLEDFCKEEIQKISCRVAYMEIVSIPEPRSRDEFLHYSRVV